MFGLTVTGNPPMKPVEPVHDHRQVVREHRHAGEGRRGKEMWVTDVRLPDMLHGRVVHPKTLGSTLVAGGHARQGAVPERAGHRQGQSRRRRRADRMGSDQGRAEPSRPTRSGPTGRACPATRSCTSGCASRRTGRATPVVKGDKNRGDVAPALRSGAEDAHRELRAAVHEACADRSDRSPSATCGPTAPCSSTRTTRTRRRCAARSR